MKNNNYKKMIKKLQIASLIMLVMVLVVSCAPKPSLPAPTEKPEVPITTGEAPVDEVAEDISDTADADEELDTSELEEVDTILKDIENI